MRLEASAERDSLARGIPLMKLDGCLDNLADVRLFRLDTDLSAGDRTEVEQIVHDVGQRARVARDRLPASAGFLWPQAAMLQQARPSEDRVQGGAQLVSERFQKFVLEPPGALGFEACRALVLESRPQFVRRWVHECAELWPLEAAIASPPRRRKPRSADSPEV